MNKLLRILILFIIIIDFAQARDLAVMLAMDDQKLADQLYEFELKELGFSRTLSRNHQQSVDYHVSIGYIDDVEDEEVVELNNYLVNILNKLPIAKFEFGAVTLLGKKNLFMVAIPKNTEIFSNYNKILNQALVDYKNNRYKIKSISKINNYIPHLTLNAKLHKDIKLNNLSAILSKLNQNLQNLNLALPKIIIN